MNPKYNSIIDVRSKIIDIVWIIVNYNVKFDIRCYVSAKLKIHDLYNIGPILRQNKDIICQQLKNDTF